MTPLNPLPTVRAFAKLLAALIAAAAMLMSAPAAFAAAPITKVFAAPITASSQCNPDGTGAVLNARAGLRTDFCISYAISNPSGPAGDDMKSLIVDTPVGYSGNPDKLPQCSNAAFNYASQTTNPSCPAGAQVGDVRANIRTNTILLGTQTLANVPGRVFNLERTGNEVARLGIVLDPSLIVDQPKSKILVRITLRPAPDVGLRSIIDNLPQTACTNEILASGCGRALATDQFSLRFWGSQADHPSLTAPYGTLGSDCSTDQVTRLSSVAYDGTPSSGESRYRLTDCDTASFDPKVAVTTSETKPDVPTATTVKVTFGGFDDPTRGPAMPKKTVVTLPKGLALTAQIASGPSSLRLCTAAQFARTEPQRATCPANTAVGTVQFASPVLNTPLTGNVYLGPQPAIGEQPLIYMEADSGDAPDAPRVKLVGRTSFDDQGRVVTTVEDLPEQPNSEFTLTFRGGPNSVFSTPESCGTTSGNLAAFAYGNDAVARGNESPLTIDQDCDAVGAFAPSLQFSLGNPNAGQYGSFTSTVSRPDRSLRFTRTAVDLPPGALARLKGVPECSAADAAAGSCPAATRIGTISSLTGVGPEPLRTAGELYLTERQPGAVAGVSIRVPVVLGDVDLGLLIVPARIEIRPSDLGLRFIADVPLTFRNVPLNTRQLVVSLDRERFALNPTNCSPLSTTSTFTASTGAQAAVTAGIQVQNCAALPFAPKLDAAISGQTANKGRPTIQIRIASAEGSSSLGQTYVTLPKGVGVDLTQVPRACAQDLFAAGGCPDTAKIGKVSGALAVADEPLGGDLYLLKAPKGSVLPGLGMQFNGRFSGRVVGTNAVDPKTGQLVSQFPSVPDLPLTALQIDINGGNGGPVIATDELCKSDAVVFSGRFVSQSGQSTTGTVNTTCGASLAVSGPRFSGRLSGVRRGRPVVRLTGLAPTGKTITKVQVTLPRGWTLAQQRGRRTGTRYAKVSRLSTTKGAAVKRRSSRVLEITLPSGGSSSLSLLTRTGTIAIKSTKLRRTKAKVRLSAKVTVAGGQVVTVPISLTPR